MPVDIKQPVEVVHLLKKYGMSLRKAHDTINRLAKRETFATELYANDRDKVFSELSGVGVDTYVIKIPEADAKQTREYFGLSQGEFALRFGFEIDTIQNWEQGRNMPDRPTQLLLKIIETNPHVVEAVLTNRVPQLHFPWYGDFTHNQSSLVESNVNKHNSYSVTDQSGSAGAIQPAASKWRTDKDSKPAEWRLFKNLKKIGVEGARPLADKLDVFAKEHSGAPHSRRRFPGKIRTSFWHTKSYVVLREENGVGGRHE